MLCKGEEVKVTILSLLPKSHKSCCVTVCAPSQVLCNDRGVRYYSICFLMGVMEGVECSLFSYMPLMQMLKGKGDRCPLSQAHYANGGGDSSMPRRDSLCKFLRDLFSLCMHAVGAGMPRHIPSFACEEGNSPKT